MMIMMAPGFAQEEELWDRFAEDWVNLLYAETDVLVAQSAAYQAIINLHQETTWENLADTKVKTAEAVKTLEDYAALELTQQMTDADYLQLTQMEIDVGDVQAEYLLYNGQTRDDYLNMEIPIWTMYYQQGLSETMTDPAVLDDLAANAAADLAFLKLELKDRYLVNNIILLEVPEEAGKHIEELVETYVPSIIGLYDKPFESVNEAINEMVHLLDEMEEILLIKNSI